MPLKPLQAIRKYCLYCMNGQGIEVNLCFSISCLFYACRYGQNETEPRKSALQLIKKYCLDCSNGSSKERVTCWDEDCSLFPYRHGKNPLRVGVGNQYPDPFVLNSRADLGG